MRFAPRFRINATSVYSMLFVITYGAWWFRGTCAWLDSVEIKGTVNTEVIMLMIISMVRGIIKLAVMGSGWLADGPTAIDTVEVALQLNKCVMVPGTVTAPNVT